MIRIILIWGVVLFFTGKLAAQDTLRRTDNVLLIGKVLAINGSQVQFTKTAEPGRTYVIRMADLISIQYEDGRQQIFATASPVGQPPAVHRGKNILGWRPLDLFLTNFTVTYERLSARRTLSWRVPVSVGLDGEYTSDAFSYGVNKVFSIGLDVNFTVGIPDRFRYYVGPTFQLGFFRLNTLYYFPFPMQTSTKHRLALGINNGVWYQVSRNLLIGGDVGLGLARSQGSSPYSFDNPVVPTVAANVNLGIQF
jgi:hypothetical protein